MGRPEAEGCTVVLVYSAGKKSGATGFEPVRARPNGFQVQLLNHSDKRPNAWGLVSLDDDTPDGGLEPPATGLKVLRSAD